MISDCFEVSSVAALFLIPQQKMTTVRNDGHEIESYNAPAEMGISSERERDSLIVHN